jgi:hypothetical protein
MAALPAAADTPVPPAQAAPDSYAITHVVRPLREIGHLTVRAGPRPFCVAFSAAAAPAATAALAYERRLIDTSDDFAYFNLTNELAKQRSMRAVEDDLRELAEQAQRGRTELAALRASALGKDDETSKAIVAFADALDGAKGRQMELARKLARVYGRLAETPAYSIIDRPSDYNHRFSRRVGGGLAGDIALTPLPSAADPFGADDARVPAADSLFSLPDDAEVGHDLARAADYAQQAEGIEHC